ncbi:carboxypeptidase-like regulatory domain-containing protein [Botryobacter ruber]|uniref:carboxypeptidase-like regulatory domain-containing protein n=1 Tax=Botryobacter ruber TaxID=2171629 RepID=UPI000E0BBDDD|nr:carboxypeptidase-like regulatory domain-containing protein [Botryobacter ruber]
MQAPVLPLPKLKISVAQLRQVLLVAGLLLFTCTCTGSFAQIKGRVTDAKTGAPVAYANIQLENGTGGTTAAEDGTFFLEQAVTGTTVLVVSSVGYERKSVRVTTSPLTIALAPQALTLGEVTVRKPGKVLKRTIGAFRKSAVRSGFGIGSNNASPWIIARFFPYHPEYAQTPYLEKLTFVTRSGIRNARIRLRLLQVTAAGAPGADLLQVPLIVTVPNGNKAVTINLNELNVRVPQAGFFVAFEWLLLPGNRKLETYTTNDGTKKTTFSYEPTLAASLVNSNHHTWIYTGGVWTRSHARHSDGTYSEPQYRIVLSQ